MYNKWKHKLKQCDDPQVQSIAIKRINEFYLWDRFREDLILKKALRFELDNKCTVDKDKLLSFLRECWELRNK